MPLKLKALASPWPSFLKEVDEALKAPVGLQCLGGFVLTVQYGMPRGTDDLDYISIIPRSAAAELERLAGRGSKLSQKYKVFLQNVGAIPDLPDSYKERLVQLELGLSKLSLKLIVDPYDLALSKLTRNNTKDREDVKFLATQLHLSFKELVARFDDEMKPWLPNLDRHSLTLEKLWKDYFSD